jgi:hypothetical protein
MALTHIPHLTISPYTALTPTQVNNNPPQAKVWRNYNYPPGQRSRYPGAFRINTVTAVRATYLLYTRAVGEGPLLRWGACSEQSYCHSPAGSQGKRKRYRMHCHLIQWISYGLNYTYYTYPGILLSFPVPSHPISASALQ